LHCFCPKMYVLNARTVFFTVVQQSELLSCWLIDVDSVFKVLARLSDYSSNYFVSPIASSPLPWILTSSLECILYHRCPNGWCKQVQFRKWLLVWLAMASKCSNCVSETKIAALPPFPHVSYSSLSSLHQHFLCCISDTSTFVLQSVLRYPRSHMFHDFALGAIFSVDVA